MIVLFWSNEFSLPLANANSEYVPQFDMDRNVRHQSAMRINRGETRCPWWHKVGNSSTNEHQAEHRWTMNNSRESDSQEGIRRQWYDSAVESVVPNLHPYRCRNRYDIHLDQESIVDVAESKQNRISPPVVVVPFSTWSNTGWVLLRIFSVRSIIKTDDEWRDVDRLRMIKSLSEYLSKSRGAGKHKSFKRRRSVSMEHGKRSKRYAAFTPSTTHSIWWKNSRLNRWYRRWMYLEKHVCTSINLIWSQKNTWMDQNREIRFDFHVSIGGQWGCWWMRR